MIPMIQMTPIQVTPSRMRDQGQQHPANVVEKIFDENQHAPRVAVAAIENFSLLKREKKKLRFRLAQIPSKFQAKTALHWYPGVLTYQVLDKKDFSDLPEQGENNDEAYEKVLLKYLKEKSDKLKFAYHWFCFAADACRSVPRRLLVFRKGNTGNISTHLRSIHLEGLNVNAKLAIWLKELLQEYKLKVQEISCATRDSGSDGKKLLKKTLGHKRVEFRQIYSLLEPIGQLVRLAQDTTRTVARPHNLAACTAGEISEDAVEDETGKFRVPYGKLHPNVQKTRNLLYKEFYTRFFYRYDPLSKKRDAPTLFDVVVVLYPPFADYSILKSFIYVITIKEEDLPSGLTKERVREDFFQNKKIQVETLIRERLFKVAKHNEESIERDNCVSGTQTSMRIVTEKEANQLQRIKRRRLSEAPLRQTAHKSSDRSTTAVVEAELCQYCKVSADLSAQVKREWRPSRIECDFCSAEDVFTAKRSKLGSDVFEMLLS
eukprot:IDg2768t1